MLHDELVARQSLIRSDPSVDSVKNSTWSKHQEEHVTLSFDPLTDRNSLSQDVAEVPIESRKTITKPLPLTPKYIQTTYLISIIIFIILVRIWCEGQKVTMRW